MRETVAPREITLGEHRVGEWRFERGGFGGGSVLAIYTLLENRRRVSAVLTCSGGQFEAADRILRAILSTVRVCAPRLDAAAVGRWRGERTEAQGEDDPVGLTEFFPDGTFEIFEAVRDGDAWRRKEGGKSTKGDWSAHEGTFYAATVEGHGIWTKTADVEIRGEPGRRTMKAVFVGGTETLSHETR